MPNIRYVCLSDLHFGAANSLLSNTDGDGRVVSGTASPILEAFVDCLAAVIGANTGGAKPTLILNGDVLELALTSDEVALSTFEQFVRLAMAERDLFAHEVVYLPGNHDHHIWETAREEAYAAYIRRHRGEPIAPPWHATPMFAAADPDVRRKRLAIATVPQEMLHRFPELADATIEVRYPAFAVDTPDHSRAVVFHHGHYAEGIYQLMTTLKATAFPFAPPTETLAQIEGENFAWVDFFWGTLGRSGDWGSDVGALYEMLQDKGALAVIGDNIGTNISDKMTGRGRHVPRPLRRWVARSLLRRVANRIFDLERNKPSAAGPPETGRPDGVEKLLSGAIRRQLVAEDRTAVTDLTFVYGHTHHPNARIRHVAGISGPVPVYNTGGWVVDTLDADRTQGASVVLVDDDLEVVSLDLYLQTAGLPVPPGVSTAGSVPSALATHVRGLLDASEAPWSTLHDRLHDAIGDRHNALRQSIARSVRAAQGLPPD
jgi:hypothetical protein